MTGPSTPGPALLTWAGRVFGARPTVQDASPPRKDSRVRQLVAAEASLLGELYALAQDR
ncbi:hypothetical protein AB0E25_29700 [Streptomyces bobili]|uniref:hypothetical protein n=1 Tax=Streptomyces bobili TaxID=67280 RepID=UPI0033F215D2